MYLSNMSSATVYNLVLDEVNIRKKITYDGKQMLGYIDYGGLIQVPAGKKDIEAKAALFFMLVEINGSKSFPLGYILTNGISATIISEIIHLCLCKTAEAGASVINVTFDGLPANITALEMLGANLDATSTNFQCHFPHPITQDKVYVMLDSSHMFKLARNAWKNLKVLVDTDGNVSKYIFIHFYIKIS